MKITVERVINDRYNHYIESLNGSKLNESIGEKYRIKFEPYERYTSSGVKTATFTAPNLFEALCKVCDKLLLYFNREDIEEEGYTVEDILNRLHSENGDGCDFIISIENISTGKTIFDDSESYFTDDDWDLDESLNEAVDPAKIEFFNIMNRKPYFAILDVCMRLDEDGKPHDVPKEWVEEWFERFIKRVYG